jgi:hypothetical protein
MQVQEKKKKKKRRKEEGAGEKRAEKKKKKKRKEERGVKSLFYKLKYCFGELQCSAKLLSTVAGHQIFE